MIMQHKEYPLPPLFLTEVIERCIADHRHTHSISCIQAARCHRSHARACDMVPVVVSIGEGNGKHQHDENCAILAERRGYKC